ncbi:hypothetical protein B0T22DRAFT_512812 [Podospora appendiculata]|uniref:Modin n=1 Tax=Podospora appendiculata TaxID=314037 RepID=A0AAE0XB04_9PEZI|nr:hypothetical protein B0T22DRAFT_512812 [Podospora appendiculata]
MSDSGSSNSQDSLNDKVAIAALVISTLALLGVVLQYVQTILARSYGLPYRDKEVLGKWAPYARLKWGFFRVEVEYEAPIIFLAANNNENGPQEGIPWYVDGSHESCVQTRVEDPTADPEFSQTAIARERVHTVKHELATWIHLISATQKMERDSKIWETNKWRQANMQQPPLPKVVSLVVNIQPMKRSFDKHPATRRPYATTAICHIIELCAVLGIYWKEFDRDNNKYRAEGNGYSVLGSRINDFGLVFTFEKPGWPQFKKNRVIPTAEVKELCFGNVPTFYRPENEDVHWKQPVNEQASLKTLQLGSRAEIAETLNLIRCNEYTTQCYSDPKKKHAHLFPVVFEVLGMLARPLHARNRAFTYLPNPVITLGYTFNTELANSIHARARKLDDELPYQEGDYSPEHLNHLHQAIDYLDSSILSDTQNAKDVVLDVLRRHVQEVLLAINTTNEGTDSSGNNNNNNPAQSQPQPTIPKDPALPTKGDISFSDLLQVPHEKREFSLMDKYFSSIRPRAVNINTDLQHPHDQQAAKASLTIHDQQQQQEDNHTAATHGTEMTNMAPTQNPDGQPPALPRHGTTFSTMPFSRSGTWVTNSGTAAGPTTSPIEVRRNTIWCALVFRMICWLMLHNFDKKDVQLPKSELMGSRLSVFIV